MTDWSRGWITTTHLPATADASPDAGAGLPEWLPAGAVIYADFVNGRYWAGGAERTLNQMFYATSHVGSWDPETDITPDGLVDGRPGINRDFIGDLLTQGFSCVFAADFGAMPGGNKNRIFAFDDPGDTFEMTADFFDSDQNDNIYWFDNGGDRLVELASPIGVGLHKCGVTLTPASLYLTRDGEAGSGDAIAWSDFAANAIVVWAAAGAIKTTAFYAPLDNATLQALTQ
jgi:hypothetical protein